MDPLVTILIVTYNHEKFIGECLEGALKQTYRNLEILVLDDASTDGTRQVIEQYRDPRIRYVRRPHNFGLVKNYNEGLGTVHGEFIWTMGGDDVLVDSEAVAAVVGEFGNDPDLGYIFHRPASNVESVAEFLDWGPEPKAMAGREIALILCEQNRICGPATVVRSDLLRRFGVYPEPFACLGDLYAWFRVALECRKVVYRPERRLFYRQHDSNLSALYSSKLSSDMWVQSIQLRLAMLSLTRGFPEFDAQIMKVLRGQVHTLLEAWRNDVGIRDEIEKALDRRLAVGQVSYGPVNPAAILRSLFREEIKGAISMSLRHRRPRLLLRTLKLSARLPRMWRHWDAQPKSIRS
jgi:glycosyltransferase involved in cell wall biosynthesis